MKPTLGVSLLAIATGLLLALLKTVASFLGASAFFGSDVLVCAAVGILTAFYPEVSRRWVVFVAGPVLTTVLFFVVIIRVRVLAIGIGWAWSASILTTALAAATGALLGGWISRRRGRDRTTDGVSRRSAAHDGGKVE